VPLPCFRLLFVCAGPPHGLDRHAEAAASSVKLPDRLSARAEAFRSSLARTGGQRLRSLAYRPHGVAEQQRRKIMTEQNKPTQQTRSDFDSIRYCIDFWKDALDAEDEIDRMVREMPRHVRSRDDVA
jgi:hypothetical protein